MLLILNSLLHPFKELNTTSFSKTGAFILSPNSIFHPSLVWLVKSLFSCIQRHFGVLQLIDTACHFSSEAWPEAEFGLFMNNFYVYLEHFFFCINVFVYMPLCSSLCGRTVNKCFYASVHIAPSACLRFIWWREIQSHPAVESTPQRSINKVGDINTAAVKGHP